MTAAEIIANNLPTFAECYAEPREIVPPSSQRKLEAADRIIDALERARYRIVQPGFM